MNEFWIGSASLLLLVFVLTLIAVWSRKDHWGRTCIVVLACLSIPTILLFYANALGNHRPISWEQFVQNGNQEYKILGYKIEYEAAIYLYLDQEGSPLALVLPWSEKVAEELQDAIRDSGEGGETTIVIPYERSLDPLPPVFHANPQPKFLPDKPRENPQILEREEQEL